MSGELRVTRIGHSCHLIQIGGLTMLTDPWFTATSTYDPGEVVAMSVADLPQLDAVVITHEHYDHFDIDTFARYAHKGVPVFVGPGLTAAARQAGVSAVGVL